MRHILIRFLLALCLVAGSAAAIEPFVVKDIRVDGLQRITLGTVFNYLTIKVGDRMDDAASARSVRELFKTGFFDDIAIGREGDTLLISVLERPSISKIDIEGNDSVPTEGLTQAFKDVGLAVGAVYDPLVLDKVKQELLQQYFNNGKYAAKVSTRVTPQDQNRVLVTIDVVEGDAAKIKQINIVGNESFDDEVLLDGFELSSTEWLSFWTDNDQYSKQKLSADLERLRSYYLDRGYINFKVESTQVSITPDKKDIYITINVSEGKIFSISEVKLAGELILPPEKLIDLISVQPGDDFSRKKATQTSKRISDALGHEGYSFANVNMIPDIDDENAEVKVTFFVDPGKRVYVRRINMEGNTKTRDEVLRRELRQMEAASISTLNVEKSKQRLSRLGYFETVDVETPPVPGSTDQVDVKYSVVEKASGNLLAGIGFSQSQGVVLNASISQNNFLGTGKRVGAAFNNSAVNRVYSVSYLNPYYTIDGISRGFSMSYRTTDADEANTTDYQTETAEAGVSFGFPINEEDRINLGLDFESTTLDVSSTIMSEVTDFVDDNGDSFTNFRMSLGWSHDSRDRAIFATKGGYQRISGSITVPGSDLEFYKLSYRNQHYFPITKHTTLALKADLAYGDSYGDLDALPFFENFFAGGNNSVRGFEDNSLGPRDVLDDPLGGDTKIVGNMEYVFPVPYQEDSNTLRLAAFLDAGNVYSQEDGVDLGELKYSVGLAVKWFSPFGALSLSIAQPFNDNSDDDVQVVQFSLGAGI